MTPELLKALVDDAEYQRSKGHDVIVVAEDGLKLASSRLEITEGGQVLNVMLVRRDALYRLDASRVVGFKIIQA